MAKFHERLAIAFHLYESGRPSEAEQIYRRLLSIHPACTEAWHFLGAIAFQTGQPVDAVQCFARLVELAPHDAEAHGKLGNAFHALGILDNAIAAYPTGMTVRGIRPCGCSGRKHRGTGTACFNQSKKPFAICSRLAVDGP